MGKHSKPNQSQPQPQPQPRPAGKICGIHGPYGSHYGSCPNCR